MTIALPSYSKSRARNAGGTLPAYSSRSGGLTASGILALAPAAWFRYGRGATVTGAGVSQWDDQSGNGRHLKQGTDAARPVLQADGSVLFDGLAQFLKCDAFTLNQPTTIYLLAKQVTWTSTDYFFDGNTSGMMGLQQAGVTPSFRLVAGGSTPGNAGLPVDTYGVICSVFNGASSLTTVNQGAAVTGNAGANNAGGFTLGANGGPNNYSNTQFKEVVVFATAHDSVRRAQMFAYLAGVGRL